MEALAEHASSHSVKCRGFSQTLNARCCLMWAFLGECFCQGSRSPNRCRSPAVSEWENHTPAESPFPRWLLPVQPRGDRPPGQQGDACPALPAAADRAQLLPGGRGQPRQQVPSVHRAAGRVGRRARLLLSVQAQVRAQLHPAVQ